MPGRLVAERPLRAIPIVCPGIYSGGNGADSLAGEVGGRSDPQPRPSYAGRHVNPRNVSGGPSLRAHSGAAAVQTIMGGLLRLRYRTSNVPEPRADRDAPLRELEARPAFSRQKHRSAALRRKSLNAACLGRRRPSPACQRPLTDREGIRSPRPSSRLPRTGTTGVVFRPGTPRTPRSPRARRRR